MVGSLQATYNTLNLSRRVEMIVQINLRNINIVRGNLIKQSWKSFHNQYVNVKIACIGKDEPLT